LGGFFLGILAFYLLVVLKDVSFPESQVLPKKKKNLLKNLVKLCIFFMYFVNKENTASI
jgi:hypothetical protein